MDFGKSFFEKHQAELVRFVNSRVGRWFFALKAFGIPEDFKISQILPNALISDLGLVIEDPYQKLPLEARLERPVQKLGQLRMKRQAIFSSGNRFQGRLETVYAKAAKILGAGVAASVMRPVPALGFLPLLALTTTDFFPDPNPETTSVDGYAARFLGVGSGEAWSSIRTNAGNLSADSSTDDYYVEIGSDSGSPNWRILWRAIFLFDTSSLDNAAVISAATLGLRGTFKSDDCAITPNLNIYDATPASNTAIANGDYNQTGGSSPTALATAISYASYSTSGYNTFTLNASGIAAISLTGVSKFSARNANYDAAASAPTHPGSAQTSILQGNFADNSGTSSDPKLSVTYTVPTAYTQTCTEAIAIVDTRTMLTDKPLTEAVTIVDTVVKLTGRVFSDIITLVDSILNTPIFLKILDEVVAVVDTVTTKITGKIFTEVVTVVDTAITQLSKVFSETVVLVATFFRTPVFKVLTETIRVVDTIRNIFNGILAGIWKRTPKDNGTWTKTDRPS